MTTRISINACYSVWIVGSPDAEISVVGATTVEISEAPEKEN